MKTLIIYNSYSGKNKIIRKIEYIKSRLKEKYNVVDCYESKSKHDIKNRILLCANQYNTILIAGGDGSLNEAINGLMLLKEKPILGYIPMGTCNDFGHSLGLTKSIDKIMDIILEGEYVYFNINQINSDYFIYGMAAGNFTDVSYKTKQIYKRRMGVLAYFVYAIKSFFLNKSFSCNINMNGLSINRDCYCLIIVNSRFLASFKLRFKNKILNNGLNVVLINKKNRFINFIDLLMFFLFGEKYNHNIEYYSSKGISINSKEGLKCNIDGEEVPILNNVSINVIDKSIKFIVDKRIKEKYFNN